MAEVGDLPLVPDQSLDEVSPQRLDEIEHFFIAYNQMEGRQFKPLARRGPARAHNLLKNATRGTGAGSNGARRSQMRAKK